MAGSQHLDVDSQTGRIYRFGSCSLDATLRDIRVDNQAVDVQPKVFDLLLYLIENRHRMIDKDELLDRLWPGSVVTESSLTQAMRKARAIVGDDGDRQEVIRTVHGRGYRFVAPVELAAAGSNVVGGDTESAAPVSPPATARRFRRRAAALGAVLLILGIGALIVSWPVLRGSPERTAADPIAQGDGSESTDGAAGTNVPAKSIAVLPFVDLSEDGSQEYFGDGLSEELLNVLANIPDLHVAARTSSFSFKRSGADIPTIAGRLRVAHVLEGSVRRSDDRVRITAQLVRADSGYHVWSKIYDRELGDIFAIQEDIANAVVENLRVRILGGPPSVPDVDPAAYSSYLLAQQSARLRTPDGYEKSNALYREALDIEPDYAAAWNGLAANFRQQTVIGLRSFDEGYTSAREAAQRAVAIDPDYASAIAQLGRISVNYEGDLSSAAGYLTRAMQLEPANTSVLTNAAVLAFNLGRVPQAVRLGEYIASRDPLNPAAHSNLGLYYLYGGSLDKAIASYQRALALSPGRTGANYEIGIAHLLKGQPEQALTAFADEKDDEWRVKGTAMALHDLDRRSDYEAALTELEDGWGERWPSEVAQVYAWTGDADAAFEWLDKSVSQNEGGVRSQFLVPLYAPLHSDPRWHDFRERTGSSDLQLAAIEFRIELPD